MCIENTNWMNVISTAAAFIGASAWLSPWVYKKFTKPSMSGNLVSHMSNLGQFNNKKCLLHFIALNVISLHRSFNIKETKITVKYQDSENEYIGKLFWARKNEWAGQDRERLTLEILPEDTLPFVGTIPQDTTKLIYITFKVDKAELAEFKQLKIEFTEQSGLLNTITIDFNLIDDDQILWDDRIWKRI